MRKLFLFLAATIASLPALCQDKILLREDFRDNKNKWRVQKDSSFSVDILHGVLRIEKFLKSKVDVNCLWYTREIKGLNTLQNFSIAGSSMGHMG